MKFASRAGMPFFKGTFDASTVANDAYKTPAGLGPKLGSLSWLPYKEAEVRVQVTTDAVGTVRVMAGDTVLASAPFNGNLATALEVDLAVVQGQTRLELAIDVETAGTGTGTVEAILDVDQPAIMSGC